MNKKTAALIFLVTALAVGFFLLKNDGQKRASIQPFQAIDTNAPIKIKPVDVMPRSVRDSNVAMASTTNPAFNEERVFEEQATIKRIGEMSAAMEAKNVSIVFYGRVIDQEGNSLSGASIHAHIRHWQLAVGGASILINRETDAEGRFEIHGLTGDSLGVESICKSGYELEPGQFSFSAVSGSINTPILFKMWSTNIHEKLIIGGKSFQPVTDGRSYFINLTDGTVSETGVGDLKVWIQYTNQIVRGQIYDWSCEVEVINGGLLEDNSPAPFFAPIAGYTPKFKFEQQIKGGQRGSIGDKQFFLRLKNGQQYGQMKIDLIAPYNPSMGIPALIRFSYAINPSGSRILR